MRARAKNGGADNAAKAAAFREKLLKAAPPEEPPAFNAETSALSVVPDAEHGGEPDPIAEAEAAWAEAPQAQAGEPEADVAEEKPKRGRRPKAPRAIDQGLVPGEDEDDEDPTEIARRLGLNPTKLR